MMAEKSKPAVRHFGRAWLVVLVAAMRFAAATGCIVPAAFAAQPTVVTAPGDGKALVESDKVSLRDVSNGITDGVFSGNVVIEREGLRLRGEKATYTTNPRGWRHFTLTAAPGQTVSFRKLRTTSPPTWFEGSSDLLTFDEETDVVTLTRRATMAQSDGKQSTHVLSAASIRYRGRDDVLEAFNMPDQQSQPGQGRVRMQFPGRAP